MSEREATPVRLMLALPGVLSMLGGLATGRDHVGDHQSTDRVCRLRHTCLAEPVVGLSLRPSRRHRKIYTAGNAAFLPNDRGIQISIAGDAAPPLKEGGVNLSITCERGIMVCIADGTAPTPSKGKRKIYIAGGTAAPLNKGEINIYIAVDTASTTRKGGIKIYRADDAAITTEAMVFVHALDRELDLRVISEG